MVDRVPWLSSQKRSGYSLARQIAGGAIALGLGIGAPSAAIAGPEENPGANGAPIQLAAAGEVPEIVIRGYRAGVTATATKTTTELRNVPQSVSVVTRNTIDDLDMQNMADVVRYVPGVSMGLGEGHRDAPTLRGNSTTADFFIDGVRDDVQYYRDLYNVERVEVLKGPNAMIFGRGGGGGVINRVMKRADGTTQAAIGIEAGSSAHYRIEGDAGAAVSNAVALRLNATYENSDSYRSYFKLERYGINPSASFTSGDSTSVDLSYEYYDDRRTVDRGIPSQNGTPYATGRSTFFGNPELSYSATDVHLVKGTIAHDFTPDIKLRNHTLFGAYDKAYQNVFARNAVTPAHTLNLEAYRSGTKRKNLFNQTDFTWDLAAGGVRHILLAGVELGGQWTDNLRDNSTFNPVVSALTPLNSAPVVFNVPNQDNHVDVNVVAIYAQDQITVLPELDLILGLRYDRLGIELKNRLTALDFNRTDTLFSPRAGLIYKPTDRLSVYSSYSVSFLPSSGDQFTSLDAVASALEPEKFENLEVGAKFDIDSAFAATVAVYRLNRFNTRAPGPAGTVVLTGSQRSKGVELSLSGQVTETWQVLAGYAYQDAKITVTTSVAPAGRIVPLVPKHSISFWNKYQFTPMWGAGFGVTHQSDVYASISNAVVLPRFVRVDAGVFLAVNERIEAQLNVENLFDKKYFSSAHNDNNIMPAAPTQFRLGLKARY